ncbi:MAG: UxaA family hydrolase, partial [Bacteroidota bacterium]
MKNTILKVHPSDNIIVALQPFEAGDEVMLDGINYQLTEKIPSKHKFAAQDFAEEDIITMYGVTVGKALRFIPKGSRISVENVVHSSSKYAIEERILDWQKPDSSNFKSRTFLGYHRANGSVGTRNHWIVFPLVFCENRN